MRGISKQRMAVFILLTAGMIVTADWILGNFVTYAPTVDRIEMQNIFIKQSLTHGGCLLAIQIVCFILTLFEKAKS